MKSKIIAIDGSAGCGKSTITKLLAQKFNLNYIDTGALFRTIALFLHELGLDQENQFAQAFEKLNLKYEFENNNLKVSLGNRDVSQKIREHSISSLASFYSKFSLVRDFVIEQEKKIVESSTRASILEGRDIGTVVFPEACLKVFLTASSEVRAKRRYDQLLEKGTLEGLTLKEIQNDIEARDHADSTREIAPLKKAEDAILVDTSELNIEQVFQKISKLIKEVL